MKISAFLDAPKKKVSMSFEEYKKISDLLILHIKSVEEREEEEGTFSKCLNVFTFYFGFKLKLCLKFYAGRGIKRSELVLWYLDQIQDDIETEDDLLTQKALVAKIIDRLTYTVRIFIN